MKAEPIEIKAETHSGDRHVVRYYREADYLDLYAACEEQRRLRDYFGERAADYYAHSQRLCALLRECQNVGMHTNLWNRIDAALAPKDVEMQPEAPGFDGAEAYAQYLRTSASDALP